MVHGHRVGGSSQVPQRACGHQEDECNRRNHRNDDQGVHTGEPVAEDPRPTPHVHAHDAEYGRIKPRHYIVGESPPVRMNVVLEEILRYGEDKVAKSADEETGHGGERHTAGKEIHAHKLPSAAPVGDHTGCHHHTGEHDVQELEQQFMEIPPRRLRLQALLAGSTMSVWMVVGHVAGM